MPNTACLSPEVMHAFEALPDPYLILSPDFTILTASKPYLQVSMHQLGDIQAKNVFEVFPDNPDLPEYKGSASLQQSLEWVLEHRQPHYMELLRYDVKQPSSAHTFTEKYWLPINTPVLNKAGEVEYIIHKVEDVTEQILSKRREEQSKHQLAELHSEQVKTKAKLEKAHAATELEQNRLYNLLMQAPALVCIFEGPQHVFKFVNPPYQQLVGNRPLLGKTIAEAMPELFGQKIFAMLDQVYSTGESLYAHEMKVQLDHENAGELGHNYYNFIYQATRNLEGSVEGIMVFAYDVTEQVVARHAVEEREKTLQSLNQQLSEANQLAQEANQKLHLAQLELQEINQELEQRVADRVRELQHAKAETEAQRNRLQQLFMEAPAPICILSGDDLVYEFVNPSYAQLFPERQLLGRPIVEALPEIRHNKVYRTFLEVYKTGLTHEEQELLIPFVRPEDGVLADRYFRFIQQGRFDEQGNVNGVIVFALEVTEQVEARKAVEQIANRLQLITDALPVLIGYLDHEEKYRFANHAYKAWFLVDPKELLGRPVRDVVGDKAYFGVKQYIDRALAGERLDFQSRMPYREDFVKYIQTSYVPDIREGKVEGFYTLVNDITEQTVARLKVEEREREAQALAQELEATNQELTITNTQLTRTNIDLDNFIYTASHDLKAPIYNIERLLDIVLEYLPEEAMASEELQRVKSMIEGSVQRFKRTIEHLTEVIKLQKENNQETVEVNLADVINDVKLDLSSQLEAAGARLTVDTGNCTAIQFSHKNLRSVIYNLLSNAIKYNSPDRTPEISISCKQEEDFWVIKVQDNGLGLSKMDKEKLFTMFGRLHDHVEGSGIGLYMVKKIIENADGRIEVESEASVGSTFRVYLKK